MDYSRMGGVKPTYGKNKPRHEDVKRTGGVDRNDKATLLERMKKAAADKADKASDKG
ncbi:hypothetical protein [Thalassovita aquimarina]|uniref:Uncharacterized protein n=1 Tax=Thalassovita aquimarina TaxID=2785917 RepID=A0ABS5HQA1_9RHOB|nr:hypothetical protein [Thalassovita aquimarina]MBR9651124.1 hypothetical protein [Thalassovita aquimarina]